MPPCDSSPATYFYLFLTAQILGKIVSETRKYTGQFFRAAGDTLSPQSRARHWNRLDFRDTGYFGQVLAGTTKVPPSKSQYKQG